MNFEHKYRGIAEHLEGPWHDEAERWGPIFPLSGKKFFNLSEIWLEIWREVF